ncbi:hypothetical protein GQ53DRAFT_749448 [Thozetella sp. PMI_491]|nr:hypothetical protein GQ53DRAFT_749448 [Thozetella sp. PMI_491]
MSRARSAGKSSLAITDPLVKYNSLIATGVCSPDPAQRRLAHHLQKLYLELKDYVPAPEYRTRLREITNAINSERRNGINDLATESHPIRRNPLFARFFHKTEGRGSLALTRVLDSQQAAAQIDSPKGLFLSGEVGTGKSMLLDLLADGLPTSRKKRWHFNTFMLYAFSKLEEFRRVDSALDERGYSVLWLAKEIVEESPILFLDEFQLPDRAASKIINSLFMKFFQLGGVLIASSNRMPEELERAMGSRFYPPPTGGLVEKLLGVGSRKPGELSGHTSDFAAFLEALKARCDFWHIEGVRDWRRRENEGATVGPQAPSEELSLPLAYFGAPTGNLQEDAERLSAVDEHGRPKRPAMYFTPADGDHAWHRAVSARTDDSSSQRASWQPASLVVYGRILPVPKQSNGATYWDFEELVQALGPADYISLASNYKLFIIDHIPVLPVSMKNEARRFINMLDALYEARCKLIVRAEAAPDDLFFPETKKSLTADAPMTEGQAAEDGDATYSETIAEVFQDRMSPFRPNISTYSDSPNAKYDPDQDSDFKLEPRKEINFSDAKALTGEDERFAYKRATSRLWELCSAQWHARTGNWWQPLPLEARHWEGRESSKPLSPQQSPARKKSEITLGPSTYLDKPAGLERFGIAALRKTRS